MVIICVLVVSKRWVIVGMNNYLLTR